MSWRIARSSTSRKCMLCIMGDFNVQIAECPSALVNSNIEPDVMRSGPVDDGNSAVTLLHRSSVDPSGADEPRGMSAAGAAFVDRMDLADLIVLNGPRDVGDGSTALATRGLNSVIDFILVDSAHLHLMGSVQGRHDAQAEVHSDHQLVAAAITLHGCSNHSGGAVIHQSPSSPTTSLSTCPLPATARTPTAICATGRSTRRSVGECWEPWQIDGE